MALWGFSKSQVFTSSSKYPSFTLYDNGIKQPFFSVVARGTSASREEEFGRVIRESLEKIVKALQGVKGGQIMLIDIGKLFRHIHVAIQVNIAVGGISCQLQ